MTQRLVVVAGLANSGKMPLARRFMAEDPALRMVHRDTIRDSIITETDEALLSCVMWDIADRLAENGRSVIVCAWNLEASDRQMWELLARQRGMALEWYDTRDPETARLIPPLEGWTPEALR